MPQHIFQTQTTIQKNKLNPAKIDSELRKKRMESVAEARKKLKLLIAEHANERIGFDVADPFFSDKPYYPTASQEAIETHGKQFLINIRHKVIPGANNRVYFASIDDGYYESTKSLSVKFGEKPLAWLNIGFAKDTLIIESMQTKIEEKKLLNEFRRQTHNQPAIDYLLTMAEETARKSGYPTIKIRNPKTLYFYSRPATRGVVPAKNIQRQMKILYQKIALRHGFKIEGHAFYVKHLQPQKEPIKSNHNTQQHTVRP